MPTKRARIQVLLNELAESRIKEIAEDRGLSVSAAASMLIHAALKLPEFTKPDIKSFTNETVEAAIKGADLTDWKLMKLIQAMKEIEE